MTPRDTSQVEYVCDQSCVGGEGAAQLLLATSGLQTMLKILSTHHSLKVDKHSVDSGQSADWWRLLQKSGKSADSTQMHGRNLRGFG